MKVSTLIRTKLSRLLVGVLFLASAAMGCGDPLEKLGAGIERDDQGEIFSVYLSDTRITDAGLVHLKELISLNQLYLDYTQITDAGLEQLKDLTKLQWLHLSNTQITDVGLEHLKGLTELQEIGLDGTQITDVAVVELEKVLPKCVIE